MAQHDHVIDNGSGAAVRADINNVLQAIATNNSGSSEPSTTYAHQWWFDTSNSLLKQRNADDDAWVVVASKVNEDWITYSNGVALKIGAEVGDLIAWEDLGDTAGTPTYPEGDGSQITGIAGKIQQVVNAQYSDVETGATTMPLDDTIPQITEGDEYMSIAITPTSAASKLKIEVVLVSSLSVAGTTSIALFKEGTADALTAGRVDYESTNGRHTTTLIHYMDAGAATPMTFKVRAGRNATGTLTVNGDAGSRIFGAIPKSSITITEIGA